MEEATTELLIAWSNGDPAAGEELMQRVYQELHRLALARMRHERPGHTLQPTALIHEAYLQLIDQRVSWKNRDHFLRVAATCMRRVVLKHARRRAAGKRGGGRRPATLDPSRIADRARPTDLVDLHEALDRLHAIEPRQAEIVEMRFYGGYTAKEVAGILALSESTVNREWKAARAWLTCELER